MRVTIMFSWRFLLIKRNVIFSLHNFSVDADPNATFPLLTYLRLIHYGNTGNFPDNFVSLTEILNFHTPQCTTFMTIWCFWSSDVILTPRYTSHRTILWLEQDPQVLSCGYLTFSVYPMKKQIVTIDTACLTWPEEIFCFKSPKIDLRNNFGKGDDTTNRDLWCSWTFESELNWFPCLFSGDCGSGWMMNRVRDGSKFFYNIHTQEYAWTRREDVIKDFSLLTKEEIQVSFPLLLLPSVVPPLPAASLSSFCQTGKDVSNR